MGVHVGQVEISVMPAGDAPVTGRQAGSAGATVPGNHEESWLQSQARIAWLAHRVHAQDFDD
jgi:hypothetical protein